MFKQQFIVCLFLAWWCSRTYSWSFAPTIRFRTAKMASTAIVFTAWSLHSSPTFPTLPAAAVDDSNITMMTPITMTPADNIDASQLENDRVQRKIKKQLAASGVTNDNVGGKDDSYRNSLKREQAKQEGMKKSKSQRAKDLCESLGRGC